MSYMDPPRFHFSGQFRTDPSTINNSTENYSLEAQYNNNPPVDTNPHSVWWNENGQAFFKVQKTSVTAACTQLGTLVTSNAQDSLIGAQILSVVTGGPPTPQYGRLVDLDPDQQARSMIVGLAVSVTTSDGASLTGVIRPMTIIDVWGRVSGGGAGGIASAGAMYQSVLDEVQWQGMAGTKSPVLQKLYALSPNALSIKIVLDGYQGTLTSPDFATGRMVGTIGPYFPGEPAHVLAKRRMWGGAALVQQSYGSNTPPLNPAPFQVSNGYLSLDLGNSIPTSAPYGGPFVNLGTVNAVIDPDGANLTIGEVFNSPGQFAQVYTTTAGILDIPLTPQQLQALAQAPVALQIDPPAELQSTVTGLDARSLKEGLQVPNPKPLKASGAMIALAENTNGLFASLDFNALRMQKGAPAWSSSSLSGTEVTSTAQVPLVATVFGNPAQQTINVQTVTNTYQFMNAEGEPYEINNTPMSAITFPAQVQTGPDGRATLNFTANDLSPQQNEERRSALNCQLYLFVHDGSMDTLGPNGGQPLTLLVFENSPYVASPTWSANISSIFTQYARLYPAMRSLIDLSDYETVKNNAARIRSVMTLPMAHPGFMPVTRDLSPLELDMVLRWFANPLN
ncbi:hypothetical protein [Stigmatella hybrida]|uniref:hypothetical protein n=1 Tax=Stigmatella hybrida TaxID=394097 RepID=UPI001CDB34C9|nr:hypothetical protein [Stigmatella hybrida]